MRIITFDKHLVEVKEVDTTITNFHNLLPYYQRSFFAGQGAIVLPQRNIFFNANNYSAFRLMDNVYELFEYLPYQQLNYNAAKPLTDIGFGVGSKKESYFSFLHTQNFGQRFNFSSSLRTARTEAFYQNQNPHFINFSASINFTSKNNKYLLLLHSTINRLYHQENGGVDTTDLYFGNVRTEPAIVATRMNSAVYKKNSSSIFVKQFYNLNATVDTTVSDFSVKKFGVQHFYHQLTFSENLMRYTDTLESFFPEPLSTDSAGIKDFLYHQQIENSLGYMIAPAETNYLNLDVGATHSYNYISQAAQKSNFNNTWLYAKAAINVLATFKLQANYRQAITGYNAGDYNLGAKFFVQKKTFNQLFDVGFSAVKLLSEPTYIQQHYSNSHFKWNNNFNKIGITQAGFFISSEKSTLQVNYQSISNFVYFDSLALPKQSTDNTKLFQVFFNHPVRILKFHINTNILYQKNLTQQDVLRLPEYIISEQFYFEGYLFKKAMFSQAGVELNYTPTYYGNAYMPLLNQFYVQDIMSVNGYPRLDVFFNFKVQQVRIFIKISNANYALYPTKIYYEVPLNPMYNRLFRLGLIWRFWD